MDDKNTRKLFIVWLAIVILGLAALYFVWLLGDVIPRAGSITGYGTVHQCEINGMKCYHYTIRNDEGIIFDSGLGSVQPYIFLDGRDVIVLGNGRTGGYSYDLDTGEEKPFTYDEYKEKYPFKLLSPFTKVEKVEPVKIDTGTDDIIAYDMSAIRENYWIWSARTYKISDNEKSADEFRFFNTSASKPVFQVNDNVWTIYYTEGGLHKCQEYDSESRKISYDYVLYEDDSVYVEQLTELFHIWQIASDEDHIVTAGFVNTEPASIKDCNDAYLIARREVDIPYNLVTFRIDVSSEIEFWEVTFSQKEDQDATAMAVYLNKQGITEMIRRN